MKDAVSHNPAHIRMLGRLLADLREKSGRDRAEVARLVGWSVARLERVETGEVSLTFPQVMALADVLGENPDRLIRKSQREQR